MSSRIPSQWTKGLISLSLEKQHECVRKMDRGICLSEIAQAPQRPNIRHRNIPPHFRWSMERRWSSSSQGRMQQGGRCESQQRTSEEKMTKKAGWTPKRRIRFLVSALRKPTRKQNYGSSNHLIAVTCGWLCYSLVQSRPS